jgi:hypothetical protein
MNKKTIFLLLAASVLAFVSCETSEGLKYGTLQKISHKTFPCDYYVAEFAYDGGRQVAHGESSSYQNSQEVGISAEAYDSLQKYVGKRVVFDYSDGGVGLCKPSKVLTSIRIAQ